MNEPLLTIRNQHTPQCGVPQHFVNDPAENRSRYIGYFENRYGEQWVFIYDRENQFGTLRGGDTGWDMVHRVEAGEARGLVLDEFERAWLRAAYFAAITP